MTKPILKIEVVSDVVCPWCYIGKRRLESAVQTLSDRYEFDIQYLPFELNPDMPQEGTNQKKYLATKFGSEAKYEELTNHVSGIAAQEGLVFDYAKQSVSPNTRDAHRVIWLAGKEGKQLAVKEAFMKAYFTEGVDLSKKENLIKVAVAAGLDKSKVEGLLNSDEGTPEIILSEQTSVQRGVSGVPFYIINGKYGISGAQPSEVFVQALEEIGSEEKL